MTLENLAFAWSEASKVSRKNQLPIEAYLTRSAFNDTFTFTVFSLNIAKTWKLSGKASKSHNN